MKTLPPLALLVNANIKAKLAYHDITDQQVMEATGFSRVTFLDRKNGRIAWTLAEISSVSELVGVHPSELLK